MSIEELKIILSFIGSFGLGAVISAIIVFLFLKSFLPSYLSAKGSNLATKEDIGLITEEIEKVKSQYAENLQNVIHQNNLLIEETKGRHQLRLAALDRRLQAHQEAFTLWRKILFAAHSDKVSEIVIECQEWWNQNCLYLSAGAREAFKAAYHSAILHSGLLHDPDTSDIAKSNWQTITAAGELIVKGAELPPLGEKEIEIITDKNAQQ